MKLLLLTIFFLSYNTLWAQSSSGRLLVDASSSFNEPLLRETQTAPLTYPNPTKDKVTIVIEEAFSSIHLKVVDNIGQTMLTKLEVEGQDYTFDLIDLAVGSYYILITIDGQTEAVSIVKE